VEINLKYWKKVGREGGSGRWASAKLGKSTHRKEKTTTQGSHRGKDKVLKAKEQKTSRSKTIRRSRSGEEPMEQVDRGTQKELDSTKEIKFGCPFSEKVNVLGVVGEAQKIGEKIKWHIKDLRKILLGG